MVGRPRQFDPDQVLDAAMRAFWANGYESTSLADLVSATGLHKGSLDQAFGDKHSLFVRSLKRYLAEVESKKSATLKMAETPLAGIRNVLHGFIEQSESEHECPVGCLAVKSMELAPNDAEVQKIMDEHKTRMQQSMIAQLEMAQEVGELAADKSAENISSLLMIFMNGLATCAASGMSHEEGHALLDAQLDALL